VAKRKLVSPLAGANSTMSARPIVRALKMTGALRSTTVTSRSWISSATEMPGAVVWDASGALMSLRLLRGQPEDRPDQRRGRDEQHDQRLDHQHDVDGDVLRRLHREAAGLEGAEQQTGPQDADGSRAAEQ